MSSTTGDRSSQKTTAESGGGKIKITRMDSMFKVTTPDSEVLQDLFRPTAMVAVPNTLLKPEELKDEAPHVVIVTNTHEALWWNMDTLKTNAPNRCSKEAMFDMTIVKETQQGRHVRFKSYIMDQYLVVTYDRNGEDPQFKFKLSPKPDDSAAISTFLLGTHSENGEPNYLFLGFQSSVEGNTPSWYFWYVDGDEVKIRKAAPTEMFNAMTAPC